MTVYVYVRVFHSQQVCGYDYTRKLNRMFTDVTVCADLTATFNEYLAESPDRELSHAISLSILQVSSRSSSSSVVVVVPHCNVQ